VATPRRESYRQGTGPLHEGKRPDACWPGEKQQIRKRRKGATLDEVTEERRLVWSIRHLEKEKGVSRCHVLFDHNFAAEGGSEFTLGENKPMVRLPVKRGGRFEKEKQ